MLRTEIMPSYELRRCIHPTCSSTVDNRCVCPRCGSLQIEGNREEILKEFLHISAQRLSECEDHLLSLKMAGDHQEFASRLKACQELGVRLEVLWNSLQRDEKSVTDEILKNFVASLENFLNWDSDEQLFDVPAFLRRQIG